MPLPLPGWNHDTPIQPYDKFRVAEKKFLDQLKQQLDELQVKVSDNIDEQKEQANRAYDKRYKAKIVEFNLGELVWLKDRGPKANADAVLTKAKFIGPFFVTAKTPSNEGEGTAYYLTSSTTGKRLKYSVGPHRLRRCNIDRTELKSKYPDLEFQPSTTTTPGTSTTPVVQQSVRIDKVRNSPTDTRTTETKTTRRPKTTDKQLRTTTQPLYSPAIAILRQRGAPDGLEYLVKFNDGMREWIDQSNVSTALVADYLIQKHNRVRQRMSK